MVEKDDASLIANFYQRKKEFDLEDNH